MSTVQLEIKSCKYEISMTRRNQENLRKYSKEAVNRNEKKVYQLQKLRGGRIVGKYQRSDCAMAMMIVERNRGKRKEEKEENPRK